MDRYAVCGLSCKESAISCNCNCFLDALKAAHHIFKPPGLQWLPIWLESYLDDSFLEFNPLQTKFKLRTVLLVAKSK